MISKPIAIGSACVTLALLLGFSSHGVAFSSGAPARTSGAPGEPNCTFCHDTYAVNSGTASFGITAPVALSGSGPIPITVGFSGPQGMLRGFEATIRDGSGRSPGGFTITDPTNTSFTASSRDHVTHTYTGNTELSWSFSWTPPQGLVPGPLTLYAAGNDADGNSTRTGDYVYTTSHTLYQNALTTANAVWPLGSVQTLDLAGWSHPGEDYVIALSDGLQPTPIGNGLSIPVNLSSPLFITAFYLPQLFQGFWGTLDGSGAASATVIVPPLSLLSGMTWHFSYATFDANLIASEVSNPVTVVLQ